MMESMTMRVGAAAPAIEGVRPWRGPEKVLLALCECLLPPGDTVPRAAERVATNLARQARCMSPLPRLLFFMGLRLLDWSPWFLFQAASRLSRLRPERRRAIFERSLHSRIYLRRQLGTAYNGTIFLSFYDLPEARAMLGYAIGPFMERCCDRRAALVAADKAAGRLAPRGRSMIWE
jgi:hypothetical protein